MEGTDGLKYDVCAWCAFIGVLQTLPVGCGQVGREARRTFNELANGDGREV